MIGSGFRFLQATILWLLLLVLAAAARADDTPATYPVFATGKILRTWCLGKGAVRASCAGYLAGVVDSLRGIPAFRAEACLPVKLSVEQVRRLLLNHLHENASREGHAASVLVHGALARAFPCSPPSDTPVPKHRNERIS